MEKYYALFLVVCALAPLYSMENPSLIDIIPEDLLIDIGGYCEPHEKNICVQVCKTFNKCFKNKERLLLANPLTIYNLDKSRSVFKYVCSGDAAILSLWLAHIKNIDEVNMLGMTLYHCACYNNHEKIKQILIARGANTGLPMPKISDIHMAVYKGDLDTVKELLKNKDNFSLVLEDGRAPLHIAASKNHTEIMRLLIDGGVDVDQEGKDKMTPLCYASAYGYIESAEILIAAKADVNRVDKYGNTSIYIASRHGNAEIVRILIKVNAGIDIANTYGVTPIYIASECGHAQVVDILIKVNADVNIANTYGVTPIWIALKKGYIEIASMLIKDKADINRPNEYGQTPIYIESKDGRTEMVRMLIQVGADINIVDCDGISPLNIAVRNGHMETAKMLISGGADVNKASHLGISPLHVASASNWFQIIEMLLQYGTQTTIDQVCRNGENPDGVTPLFIAAMNGNVEAAKLLLASGAAADWADDAGVTVMEAASGRGHDEIVRLLREHLENNNSGSGK